MKKLLSITAALLISASIFADPLEDDFLNNFEGEKTGSKPVENTEIPLTSGVETEATEDDFGITHDEWDYYANEFYPEGLVDDSEPKYAITDNRIFNPHRIFELGFRHEVGASNNYFTPGMILVPNLVIDLRKIADEMPFNGLQFNMIVSPNFFMNLNLPNGFHLGFTTGAEINSNIGIGKELFDFLGYGNAGSDSITLDINAYASAFAHFDLAVGLDLLDGYHFEVQPSLFLPIAHVTTEGSYGKITNTSDGKITAEAVLTGSAYLATDIMKIVQNQDTSAILSDLSSGWGFDFTTSVDKKIFDFLTVQAYTRIPILPGQLKYKTQIQTSVSGKFDGAQSLIDNMTSSSESSDGSDGSEGSEGSEDSGSSNMFSEMFTYTEPTFTTTMEEYSISRPFRIGAQASFQPYGPWFTLTGLLGMGCRQPFSSSAHGYVEYDVSVKVALPIPVIGDLIGAEFTHGYLSETFRNRLTFILNARALELNIGVSTQSSNFATSFALSGANVFLYMAWGW